MCPEAGPLTPIPDLTFASCPRPVLSIHPMPLSSRPCRFWYYYDAPKPPADRLGPI